MSVGMDSWAGSENSGDDYKNSGDCYGNGAEKDLKKALQYYEKALLHYQKALADLDDSVLEDTVYEGVKERIKDKISATTVAIEDANRRAERTLVFISYSHMDKEYYDEIGKHLNSLMDRAGIEWWGDSLIENGGYWEEEIKKALTRTKLAILMISIDFMNSEFIWTVEYPYFWEVAVGEGATIWWMPVRHCDVEGTHIDRLQAIIDPKRPLADYKEEGKYSELEKIYTKLVIDIKKFFREENLVFKSSVESG